MAERVSPKIGTNMALLTEGVALLTEGVALLTEGARVLATPSINIVLLTEGREAKIHRTNRREADTV